MSKREEQEKELNHLRQVIEDISELWEKSSFNGDGDAVVYEEQATRISMLLAQG